MKHKQLLGVIIIIAMVFSMIPVMRPQTTVEAIAKIDTSLLNQMAAGAANDTGSYKAVVKVVWNPNLELIKFNHDAVVTTLKTEASATQAPVIDYLKQKRDAHILNTFWVDNLILVDASESTIRELATLSSVERIIMDFTVTLPSGETKTYISSTNAPSTNDVATWNIQKVRAPDVWAQFGLTGQGVTFAVEDTGLDITHPDLQGALFTSDPSDPTYPGGWAEFDANGDPVWSTPHDTYGHGTATTGLIVGDSMGPYGAVGMAPGAKGLAKHVLTLPGASGTFPQVIAGLQWILDPYDQSGNHYPMPRVSSHSWGATGYVQDLIAPVRNLYYAGNFVICSIGNSGQGSSGSPGNVYEAFGVGATDIDDKYVDPSHGWSSSGEIVYKTDFPNPPADWPDNWVKPEVSAPGHNVIVPYPGNQYIYWSGTSFSCPEVAGAAILMLSGNPSLTFDEAKAALEQTAVWYNYYNASRPDTYYGWGRIDTFEAVAQVALPQGIVGTVTDAANNKPVIKAKVQVGTRTTYTDDNGNYEIRLMPGTYSIAFSRFGYEDETVNNVIVNANQFTTLNVALTLVPPGYVAGYVRFGPTQIGIPGAKVEALNVPATVETLTDVNGFYILAIPPGTYSFQASAYGFREAQATNIVVIQGQTTALDFDLTQPAVVAVLADYNNHITNLLSQKGLQVVQYNTFEAIMPDIPKFSCIIVNYPGYYEYPSYTTVSNFIAATDANGVGVLWLDSWASGTGGYYLWYYSYYSGLPIGFTFYRYTTYYYAQPPNVYNYYRTTKMDSDILDAWPTGYVIPHDIRGSWHDSAYYYMFDPETPTRQYLGSFGFYEYGYFYDYGYTSIVKINRSNNKWMMLSLHGNTYYTDATGWSDDSISVFMNSINWASKPVGAGPVFAYWNLTATPKVGLWNQDRTISVGVKNVGFTTGTTTVKILIDGTLEYKTDVTLDPGVNTYVTHLTNRFYVGTYTVTVNQLSTTFIVRPPTISVQAYQFNSNAPLVGADVYGYYRKYRAKGWTLQESIHYGGNGHSQFAQPVGDLDGDGKNEVIVGGYEVLGNGMTRILRYNPTTGKYDDIFHWSEGGGSYNSPSGAAIGDLNGDGKNELVVSWSYSGNNDGVWVYTFDGTQLTKLAHYYASFVFDVAIADYDSDGTNEILVSNAPWGGTPYHVIALRFENNNSLVFEAGFLHAGLSWEDSMLAVGDIDNDNQPEVVFLVSNGYYQTAGVWALHWNKNTASWDEQLVYNSFDSSFGTPYGIAIGELDNDGVSPEILIGNNIAGYIGAAAIILEYNGIDYTKVFEGHWADQHAVIESVAIGDANNDGIGEASIGGGSVHLIEFVGGNYEEVATLTQSTGLLAGNIIGDTDSDGKNEIKVCDINAYGPGDEWFYKYLSVPTPEPDFNLKKFGTTDANGQLTFNSPESVVDMYLFIYKEPKTPAGYQYLLTRYDYVDNDLVEIFQPTTATEAVVVAKLNSKGLSQLQHTGIVWLQEGAIPVLWPFTAAMVSPTKIVVTPQTYTFRHMLNVIDQFGSWWYYFMAADQMATLNGAQTYTYSFAGPITGSITHTQTGTSVQIDWTATDGFGHQMTGISEDEVNWLSQTTQSYMPVAIKPSLLDDVQTQVGASIDYYPLIVLFDTSKRIITSGYVQWSQKQAFTTVPAGKTVYYAELDFVSGPYGNPNTKMAVTAIVEMH